MSDLRAYSVNIIEEDQDKFRVTVCEDLTGKVKTCIMNKEAPFLVKEKTMTLLNVLGKVPVEKADAFKSDSIHIGGLPTREETEETEDTRNIALTSILECFEKNILPLQEGDILIVEQPSVYGLIEKVLIQRNKQK